MPSLPRSVRAVTMRMSLMLICVALLAGVFAISAAGQTPAENSGWWQIPTADLAYGPPLCIDFDAGGVAWIGTRGGVNMVQADGARTNIPLSDSEVEVRAIAAGPDGAMWLGTDSSTTQALGVRVIWLDGREASYDVISGLADNHVRDIVTGPAGDFWFATAGGLGHLAADLSWGRFTRAAGLIDDDVYALAFDLDGNLWIGTYGGISVLSPEGDWTTYTVADGLAGQWVRDVVVDRVGNVWCATGLGASVHYRDGGWQSYTVSDGLATNAVNAVAVDDAGGIWFATNEGASYLSGNGLWLTYNREAGLLSDTVVDIAVDEQGQPWFATAGGLSILVGGLAGQTPAEEAAPTTAPTEVVPTATVVPAAEAVTVEPSPATTMVVEPLPTAEPMNLGRTEAPAYVEIGFYVIFFLAIVGAGVMLRHIFVMRGQRRRAATTQEIRTHPSKGPEGVDVAWDEGLVPITLSDAQGEALAPEVAEALAELDAYQTPMPESLVSPVPEGQVLPSANDIAAATEFSPATDWPPEATRSEIRRKALDSWLRRATPEDVQDLMEEGIALARQGHKADAYDVFTSITRLVPEHVEAWLWKGGLAFHPREAVRCIQTALDLDPDNERAREGLAWALSNLSAAEEGSLEE